MQQATISQDYAASRSAVQLQRPVNHVTNDFPGQGNYAGPDPPARVTNGTFNIGAVPSQQQSWQSQYPSQNPQANQAYRSVSQPIQPYVENRTAPQGQPTSYRNTSAASQQGRTQFGQPSTMLPPQAAVPMTAPWTSGYARGPMREASMPMYTTPVIKTEDLEPNHHQTRLVFEKRTIKRMQDQIQHYVALMLTHVGESDVEKAID
ncbi:hypothetical protein LTR17_017773 [Elasticomyces elasticus]|nr:hypothetical protein LTR17_017773 [Elasticomyces elasticus]